VERSLGIPLALSLIAVFAVAAPAAADVSCTGPIGVTSIDDDVVVPAGAGCTLTGTQIDGNVLVGPGATLRVDGARIEGNIQDDDGGAGAVTISDAFVGGNVQLEQGTSATVRGTTIDGDLQLESNRGSLRADGNDIGGNLQANQNTGGLTIMGNTIDGNLQCQTNAPAPTGGANVVRGSAEDQCANLTGDLASPTAFDDVPSGYVHATGIDWLVAADITGGCTSDGRSFCPDRAVTRAQMASFLDRALDLPSGSVDAFTDVAAGDTHAAGIGAVARAGITRGCDAAGTRYCPADAVTRAQMATFLDRALSLPDGDVDRFVDVSASDRHAPGIGALARAGITTGCDSTGTRYCPNRPVTRGQMATFLEAALNDG
jgi:hypothetical protein